MTDAEVLIECKRGLNIQTDCTDFDAVLTQKLLAVKSYMLNAGVSQEMMADHLAVGIIVMGVADLWNMGGGEIKFSPVFNSLLSQLAISSSVLTVISIPIDGATGVSTSVNPILTFKFRIVGYSIRLVDYNTLVPVPVTVASDITGKIITITPDGALAQVTKYAIVINSAIAYSGQTMDRTVISFTTA
ncbi:MAG: Ig-like domain-containing protein [Syntrophomonas sp.]